MKASDKAIELIREFEGFSAVPYEDSAGKLSVGIGHLIKPNEHFTSITESEAEDILRQDIAWAESAVNQGVSVELNQNQYDALTSFTFNVGGGNFLKSTLLELLDDGKMQEAADQFLVWDHIKGAVSPGLLRRRKAERELFLTPMEDS